MGYRSLSCGRPAAEQRYILAMLRVFAQLPPERREAVRALIACLAETPEEGRALFGVLVQQKTLEAAAGAAGVSPRKLSRLRKKFLEQMPLLIRKEGPNEGQNGAHGAAEALCGGISRLRRRP